MQPDPLQTAYLHRCVDRWREGDSSAADELLRASAGDLERLARRMLRGFPVVRGQAETSDIVQGASLRLLNALRTIRPRSTRDYFTLSSLQIRRELLDLARKAKGITVALSEASEVAAPDEGLDLWAAFHQAVEGLPGIEREVVGLIFYHRMTQAQAAEVLGLGVRTVRRHWASVSAGLSKALGGRMPGQAD